jgi:hypothetical protein
VTSAQESAGRIATGRRLALPRWTARALALLGALGGLAVIGYAQYAVSFNDAPFDFPLTGRLEDWVFDSFGHANDLAFAIPLFIAGGLIFAIAVPRALLPSDDLLGGRPGRATPFRAAVAVLLAGLLLWGWLVTQLVRGEYDASYRWVFLVSLLVPAAALAVHDLRIHPLRAPEVHLSHLGEIVVLIGIVAAFVALNARDLENWRYTAIGDEGPFYNLPIRMLDDPNLNWFNHDDGPYTQPVLGSAWHALNMAVFGRDLFGWKMGSLTAIAVTIPALYWLLREAIGTRTAIFGAMFLGASHYLFAYAHTGYNNVFPLFPTVSAIALMVSGLKRNSYTLLFLSGVMAGLGCYTYFSSRAAIVIIAVAFLTLAPKLRRNLDALAVGALGFGMTLAPLFAVEGWDVVSKTFDRSAVGKDTPFLEQLADNLPRTIFAFNFNPHNLHYTAGALLDEITVTLAIAGLALCAFRIKTFAYRLFVIWFCIALIVTGLFSEYGVVTISRLHYALPPLAAFAAIAADRALAAAGVAVGRPRVEWALSVVVFAVLAPTIFVVNSRHFLIHSASLNPTTPETVIVRTLTDESCAEQPLRAVAYLKSTESVMWGTWRFFDGPVRPLNLSLGDFSHVYHPFPDTGGSGCAVIANANEAPALALLSSWRASAVRGGFDLRTVTDRSHTTLVEAAVPRDASPGLDPAAIARTWRTRTDLGSGLDGIVQGQSKDGIAGMRELTFDPLTDRGARMYPDEPVVVLNLGGEQRAYPERVLAWHVVLNDVVGGVPVAVTFDPIAGAARVYDRTLPDGRLLTFAVSGLLRGGNSLLYDHETETWWQQMTGEGVTGELHEQQLRTVPFSIVAGEEFRRAFPTGVVLDPPDASTIRYILNGYLLYDEPEAKPLFTLAGPDGRLPAMQRVAVLEIGGRPIAVPYPDDDLVRPYEIERDGERVVLFFDALARSPLDAPSIPTSRQIGSFTAYLPQSVDGAPLRFVSGNGLDPIYLTDEGQRFSTFGVGEDDTRLTPVPIADGFWFSVAAVYPAIEIIELDE